MRKPVATSLLILVLLLAGSVRTAVVLAVSLALLPGLQFDFNPLHLKSAKAESVATLLDLMQDPNTTPNTLDVLAPSLADAAALAQLVPDIASNWSAVTSYLPRGSSTPRNRPAD